MLPFFFEQQNVTVCHHVLQKQPILHRPNSQFVEQFCRQKAVEAGLFLCAVVLKL